MARPRIYIYELPPHLLPPPTAWRMVRALKSWVEASRFYERNPFCADYFLVPSHPQNREVKPTGGHVDVGDLRYLPLTNAVEMPHTPARRHAYERWWPDDEILLPA